MEYGKKRLVDLLLTIDEEATLALGAKGQRYPVVIVGGSAFLLHDLTNRPTTHDVDVLSCHAALRDVLANYAAVNGSVAAYADQIPYNFEDRLVKLDLPTKAVDFMTPSVEDLAVMKLYGWRPSDQQDLESPAMLDAIDWDELDRLVRDPDEAQASALSHRRYREMVSVYEDYARRHGNAPDA
ncbi:MAG: hypothetical protein IJ111_08350 [Eggerthellaceae bacterium]|nr:hypothetical protein [Eggerthellaceae bacterium]